MGEGDLLRSQRSRGGDLEGLWTIVSGGDGDMLRLDMSRLKVLNDEASIVGMPWFRLTF